MDIIVVSLGKYSSSIIKECNNIHQQYFSSNVLIHFLDINLLQLQNDYHQSTNSQYFQAIHIWTQFNCDYASIYTKLIIEMIYQCIRNNCSGGFLPQAIVIILDCNDGLISCITTSLFATLKHIFNDIPMHLIIIIEPLAYGSILSSLNMLMCTYYAIEYCESILFRDYESTSSYISLSKNSTTASIEEMNYVIACDIRIMIELIDQKKLILHCDSNIYDLRSSFWRSIQIQKKTSTDYHPLRAMAMNLRSIFHEYNPMNDLIDISKTNVLLFSYQKQQLIINDLKNSQYSIQDIQVALNWATTNPIHWNFDTNSIMDEEKYQTFTASKNTMRALASKESRSLVNQNSFQGNEKLIMTIIYQSSIYKRKLCDLSLHCHKAIFEFKQYLHFFDEGSLEDIQYVFQYFKS